MSFAEQERALFDLLFDADLRDRFCAHSTAALGGYRLTESELSDFGEIIPSGLQIDATLRAEQILGQFCHQLPASFSLLSALPGGIRLLNSLINTTTMRSPPAQRSVRFAHQLQQRLRDPAGGVQFPSARQRTMICAIVDVEAGLTTTTAALKQQLPANDPAPAQNSPPPTEAWLQQPIQFGANVVAVMVPLSYATLKSALASSPQTRNWRELKENPITENQLNEILAVESPTLFIARAYTSKISRCEVNVDHRTLELNDGFAPLLQKIDGSTSVADILLELEKVGAGDQIVQSVRNGFEQLLSYSIIKLN